MNAVDFLKTRARLCKAHEDCPGCPLEFFCGRDYEKQGEIDYIIKTVNVIEQWGKEHPIKTRQSEFLTSWPDAEIADDGLPSVAPCQLIKGMEEPDENGVCYKDCGCGVCRRDFWLKEID